MSWYREALLKEIGIWSSLLGNDCRSLRSLYIGGGTPSCMSGEEVAELVAAASRAFGLDEDAEVTVEVNPATWEEGDFNSAVEGGVNRLSIGVQSLDDADLRRLSRPHDSREARRAVAQALSSGARSVNADLIFGIPAARRGAFMAGLEELADMGLHHISAYALTLEKNTPLHRMAERGEIKPPQDDEVADDYLSACETLERKGFEHYEISNFCLPGHRCRHNLAYWRREEFLGVGAGAHSLLWGVRLRNHRSLLRYLCLIEEGMLPVCEAEAITEEVAREELIMLGLRTWRGVPEKSVSREGEKRVRELERHGLLTLEGGRVRLTARGMLVSNAVIADILYCQ